VRAAPRHGAHIETIQIGPHFDPGQIRGDLIVDSLVASAISGELFVDSRVIGLVHQIAGGATAATRSRHAQRAADLAFYRRCDLVIAASQFLAQDMLAGGVPQGRVAIVPPGRDLPEAGSPEPADLRAGRSLAVLNVSNWLPNKGILELLEAVDRVPSDEVVLHLVGSAEFDPRYTDAIRSRLHEPGLREKVVTHGVISQGPLRRLYADADVLALTSLNEGYGTVAAEALGVGLPVIAWHSGNLPNLLDHGKEGFLIPAGDIDALADHLRRLARDEHLRSTLASNAAVRGSTLPTWEQTATLFFAALESSSSSPA
jgi:glycosyltransferase involved in cell wall biosynthesis